MGWMDGLLLAFMGLSFGHSTRMRDCLRFIALSFLLYASPCRAAAGPGYCPASAKARSPTDLDYRGS